MVDEVAKRILDGPTTSDFTALCEPIDGLPTITLPHEPRTFHCVWTDSDECSAHGIRIDGITASNSVHMYIRLSALPSLEQAVEQAALDDARLVTSTVYDTSGDDTTYCPLCLQRVATGTPAIRFKKHQQMDRAAWIPSLWIHRDCVHRFRDLHRAWDSADVLLGDAL